MRHWQVTFTGKGRAPTVSPDGRRIAYVSDETPEQKLMVQELEGGRPIAVFSAPEIGHLRWSPDGRELLIFTRGAGKNGVYSMPLLGGFPRVIAARLFIACWSPGEPPFAVGSYAGGKIWLLNKLGQPQRTIALHGVQGAIHDIDWSPSRGRLADCQRR